jgi:hypothetical protein
MISGMMRDIQERSSHHKRQHLRASALLFDRQGISRIRQNPDQVNEPHGNGRERPQFRTVNWSIRNTISGLVRNEGVVFSGDSPG